MSATDDEVPGSFSPVLHHIIAQPLDEIDAIQHNSNSLSNATSGMHSNVNGNQMNRRGAGGSGNDLQNTSIVSLIGGGDNVIGKLIGKMATMYKNRDKFTDQQKAMIYVAILMVAALLCAALVEMFLR